MALHLHSQHTKKRQQLNPDSRELLLPFSINEHLGEVNLEPPSDGLRIVNLTISTHHPQK